MRRRPYEVLIEALLGTEHLSLYRDSAAFHAQMDVIARMIPVVVNALAANAKEEALRSAELVAFMERNYSMPAVTIRGSDLEGSPAGYRWPGDPRE